MRTRPLCVAAALVCLSWPAAAQTVLSETEALARLSADSPRVRIIRVGVEVARAETLSAGRWPNPRVTFNREAVAGVSENMLLVERRNPDTLGARKILLPYSAIVAVKIVDVVKVKAFASFGFQESPRSKKGGEE